MRRRDIILQSIGTILLLGAGARAEAVETAVKNHDELMAEIKAKAIRNFPFELVQVHGEDALSEWRKLKSAGRGIPVVIGDDDSVVRLSDAFHSMMPDAKRSVQDILDAATRTKIPNDLFVRREKEDTESKKYIQDILAEPDDKLPRIVEARTADGKVTSYSEQWSAPNTPNKSVEDILTPNGRVLSKSETRAYFASQLEWAVKSGEWPDDPPVSAGLAVATDVISGKPLDKVYIALIPAKDSTEVPAYLHWGNWNDCPPPEYHVAALRYWRERYGVELIGIGADTLNLHASRRPATHEEALVLAREQYAYCTDIIDQGTQTLSVLAAALYGDDWWFFWWD